MNNREANVAAISIIATAIGDLNEEAVYVGGAVVGLYTDLDSDDSRPTKDVDFFLEITTPHKLETVREKLSTRGFKQTAEDAVLCRFRYSEIKVDVMSTKAMGWAPANEWFAQGMHHTLYVRVNNATYVQLLQLPFFLATKFAAFNDRGKDPRTSHDMEDIIYVLDGNSNWEAEINNAPDEVTDFLKPRLKQLEYETIQAHLPAFGRAKLVMERIEKFI